MKLRLSAGGRVKLSELLDRVNLPDVIARECGPQTMHGLNRDRGGVICDPRPGHHETPQLQRVHLGGRWHWNRHARGRDHGRGDALGSLEAVGYSRSQAHEDLARLDAQRPDNISAGRKVLEALMDLPNFRPRTGGVA